jgi:hypothetical protein
MVRAVVGLRRVAATAIGLGCMSIAAASAVSLGGAGVTAPARVTMGAWCATLASTLTTAAVGEGGRSDRQRGCAGG